MASSLTSHSDLRSVPAICGDVRDQNSIKIKRWCKDQLSTKTHQLIILTTILKKHKIVVSQKGVTSMSVMAIGESIVDIPFTKDKVAHPCLAASHYPIICKLKMRAYPLPISMYII